MVYMGSKNRLAKEIVPIIQKYIDDNNCENYFEPFVGGANIIDKIKCKNKYGSDINKYLIALLEQTQKDTSVFPTTVSEEEYKKVKNNMDNYDDWYVGLVGFCSSYGGKFFDTYARSKKNDGITLRDMPNERIKNLISQSSNLKNIEFYNKSFLDVVDIKNYVIYCDPPYKDTAKYKTEEFPYDEFYNWCREKSKNNIVIISEYNMPQDFKYIWHKNTETNISSKRNEFTDKKRIEKLFILKEENK